MEYRHEWKHEITSFDVRVLEKRLSVVARRDSHAPRGIYEIRSLYFDTAGDHALREKIDGVNPREKFRIRYYSKDTSFIRLEKKSKVNGLCLKDSVPIAEEQVLAILEGDWSWLAKQDLPLFADFYHKLRNRGLRPKTIVDYTREAFSFSPGSVRITLDYQIRTGLSCTDFFNPRTLTVPVPSAPAILEVKWKEFLPDIIRDIIQLPGRQAGSFSKYAACRIYG
ncbi:MAG: polyphosphate polymerase domain-containing protein [Lachnospiraceae bacterium]|nr:polyphosphate polymerase domain-containing protein [Lachnospiraceae bacterium]